MMLVTSRGYQWGQHQQKWVMDGDGPIRSTGIFPVEKPSLTDATAAKVMVVQEPTDPIWSRCAAVRVAEVWTLMWQMNCQGQKQRNGKNKQNILAEKQLKLGICLGFKIIQATRSGTSVFQMTNNRGSTEVQRGQNRTISCGCVPTLQTLKNPITSLSEKWDSILGLGYTSSGHIYWVYVLSTSRIRITLHMLSIETCQNLSRDPVACADRLGSARSNHGQRPFHCPWRSTSRGMGI